MIRMRIAGLTMDTASRTPLVVLQALDSDMLLPLWIGASEAMALSLELGHAHIPRPLPHALIGNILQAFGAELLAVHITRIENDVFYAELQLLKDGQEYRIDCRPSDALVLALRHQTPVFVSESVAMQAAEYVHLRDNEHAAGSDSESSMMEQAFSALQKKQGPIALQAPYSSHSGIDEDANLKAIHENLNRLETNLESLSDDEKAQIRLLQILDPESHKKM